jgi:ribokinase
MSRIVVCGSLNMDILVQSARRPMPGETLLGAKVSYLPGGKGLNQAVAAARLGVPTSMLGAVGQDQFGDTLRGFLTINGVDNSGVKVVKAEPTGVALIQVMAGHNAITVASGANMHFTKEMAMIAPRRRDVWVAQFETPIETTEA